MCLLVFRLNKQIRYDMFICKLQSCCEADFVTFPTKLAKLLPCLQSLSLTRLTDGLTLYQSLILKKSTCLGLSVVTVMKDVCLSFSVYCWTALKSCTLSQLRFKQLDSKQTSQIFFRIHHHKEEKDENSCSQAFQQTESSVFFTTITSFANKKEKQLHAENEIRALSSEHNALRSEAQCNQPEPDIKHLCN